MALLKEWLYEIVAHIAYWHDALWALNRGRGAPFDDKQMHFLVFAALGLLLLLACLLLFSFLSRRGLVWLMAWLFALSVMVFVCFAVEIGQFVTDTGAMELADIVYGIVGFLAASAAAGVCALLFRLVRWLLRAIRKNRER